MVGYRFDEEEMRTRSRKMNERARVAFALLCCERLFPNYVAFEREHHWGRVDAIREALDAAWDWLRASSAIDAIRKRRAELEAAAPNTEEFDSKYVSPALDAANSADALLEMIIAGRADSLVEIACLARDTVDMYVQEAESMDSSDEELEEKIRLHPLMQRELQQQHQDLECLERMELTPAFISRLRHDRRDPSKSNIELPE